MYLLELRLATVSFSHQTIKLLDYLISYRKCLKRDEQGTVESKKELLNDVNILLIVSF